MRNLYHNKLRMDTSSKLIHFTKGDNAKVNLLSILESQTLIGGTGYIKDRIPCVCFTETPISNISYILMNRELLKIDYAPFGVMVNKSWLWAQGGRPAIYQSDEEYRFLHDSQKYKHKRFEPDKNIDFTWEREWRIKTDALKISPDIAKVIVPTRKVAEEMIENHMANQRQSVFAYGSIYAEGIAAYPWHFIALEDI